MLSPRSVSKKSHESADGEHHVEQAAIFGVDHRFMDIAQILILAIDHRPGPGCLTAPPRPVASSATAEEHN